MTTRSSFELKPSKLIQCKTMTKKSSANYNEEIISKCPTYNPTIRELTEENYHKTIQTEENDDYILKGPIIEKLKNEMKNRSQILSQQKTNLVINSEPMSSEIKKGRTNFNCHKIYTPYDKSDNETEITTINSKKHTFTDTKDCKDNSTEKISNFEKYCQINRNKKNQKNPVNNIYLNRGKTAKTEVIILNKQETNIGEATINYTKTSPLVTANFKRNMTTLSPQKIDQVSNEEYQSDVSPKKSPSKWNKIKNLFRSLNSLKTYNTKNLEHESDLDEEMQVYKERLFLNTIKGRNQTEFSTHNAEESKKKGFFDTQFNLLLKMNEQSLQRKRMDTKQQIYDIIINGDSDAIKLIDSLLKTDPEFYLKEPNDPSYKFNTPLENGKTLFYVACQEGRADIVKFLLDKKINPFIKCFLDEKKGESPLEVACRWNYTNIIKILLERVEYQKEHIKEGLKIKELSTKTKNILFKYVKIKFSKGMCC